MGRHCERITGPKKKVRIFERAGLEPELGREKMNCPKDKQTMENVVRDDQTNLAGEKIKALWWKCYSCGYQEFNRVL